jgi:hypothetical protein
MSSAPASPPEAADEPIGRQHPTSLWVPPRVSSAGAEVADLAKLAGLELDPWQRLVLDGAFSERADGIWSAFEVCLIVSRQNGKGSILEAAELGWLFLFGERLIVHTAHLFATAKESFRRVRELIDGCPELSRRVAKIRTSNEEQSIELNTRQRLRFLVRNDLSGRGFSGSKVVFDEAMAGLGPETMAALLPTLSAQPNPQVWYTASAGNKLSTQLARVRRRGLAGNDPRLAFFEWACDDSDDLDSVAAVAKANPAFGIRIHPEYIAAERRSLPPEISARERLGIGDYPVEDADGWVVISADQWTALAIDDQAPPILPVAFAADATPDRSWGSIGAASRRADGTLRIEVIEHHPGTSWMSDRLAELHARWSPCALVIDPKRQANTLIPGLEAAGVEVIKTTAREMAQACGQFYEAAVDSKTLRHLGQPALNAALARATKRDLEGAWAWDGRTDADISPLVAVTLAAWGHATRKQAPTQPFFASWR